MRTPTCAHCNIAFVCVRMCACMYVCVCVCEEESIKQMTSQVPERVCVCVWRQMASHSPAYPPFTRVPECLRPCAVLVLCMGCTVPQLLISYTLFTCHLL